MNLAIFYHAYADGAWALPLAEFQLALAPRSGAPRFRIGIVGEPRNRRAVMCAAPQATVVAVADTGHESITINRVRQYAQDHNAVVLYAHAKGAAENTDFRARWRRSMTTRVVGRWREHMALLESGDVDAVGCHWLTEAAYPGMFGPQTIPAEGSGFFGGNFWMATTAYLRDLPPCPAEPRWQAESWIGRGSPRVVDLLPGWPHDNRWPELCDA